MSFSSISATSYPAWLWAFQASLQHPALHGCELFKHPCNIKSCMAVSFPSISATSYPCRIVSFSSISATSYPPWLWAFQAPLQYPTLYGCELFKHLCNIATSYPAWLCAFQASLQHPILHGCKLFKHLCNIVSCMAVSFSSIFPTSCPAWL